MSHWYNRVVDDMSDIVNCIAFYEQELEDAKAECKITGRIERASAELPGITAHRFNQLQEIESILEHLNIELRRERSKTFRKYLETYNRQLSSRDAEKYVDGEDTVVHMSQLINQFSLLRNKYLGVIKAIEAKAWQLGHIVRLRTAGLDDATI